MPLASLRDMMAAARRSGYGLCYCESWNLESLQAVIEAAEECGSPVIAGFNGGFLRHRSRSRAENLAYYASFRLALEQAPVPVAFLLNESDSLAQIEEAVRLGFNAVMPENEGLDTSAYRELVKAVVAIARPRGVWVEAQVGRLPSGAASGNERGQITDPELARDFVAETGVDALAVSVGNVHVLTQGKATVDLEAVRRIRDRVDVPLVIHGGSGLTPESMRDLIGIGVAKINFGTAMKQAYLEAVRNALARYQAPSSPHRFLGIGGCEDVMTAGRQAVRCEVKQLLRVCGSSGRASRELSRPT